MLQWVHFGEYLVIQKNGRQATVQATKNNQKIKRKEKNTNDKEEKETSKDDDVDEEIIEEPLAKVRFSSMHDYKDHLKHLSSTNLKNSPKLKETPSKNISEEVLTLNDLEGMKKRD